MQTRLLVVVLFVFIVGCAEGLQGTDAGYPPDNNLAVGAGYVVETTNAKTRIWQNNTVVAEPYTNSIFTASGGCSNYAGDPRVLFDAATGRWFMVAIGSRGDPPTYFGSWCLAVSQSSNPLGAFYRHEYFYGYANEFPDQPGIDVSENKVVLTGFVNSPQFGLTILVLDKAALIAGQSASYNSFLPGANHFLGIPARTLTANDIVYLVGDVDGTPANSARIRAIKGVPGQSQVTITNADVTLSATTSGIYEAFALRDSPDSLQIGLRSNWGDAVRFNDSLWAAQVIACRPAGDTADRACIRIYEFMDLTPTDPFTPSERQRVAIRSVGDDYLCPALTVDVGGDLVVVTNKTSEAEYPSIYMTGRRPGDAVGTLRALTKVHAGTVPYHDDDGQPDTLRWGDYCGAASVSGTTYVWTVAQYTKDVPAGGNSKYDFGTWITGFNTNDIP